LHLGETKQTKIILPPIELQNQFADFVQKSEESKAAIQASLESLSAVYKKIIAENLGEK
jgi:type I restriction enzyme S subunit